MQGFWFNIHGFGVWALDPRFWVLGFGFWVRDLGIGILGLGFRVLDFCFCVCVLTCA